MILTEMHTLRSVYRCSLECYGYIKFGT